MEKWSSKKRIFKVKRYFLEVKFNDLKKIDLSLPDSTSILKDDQRDFNINKFFYKQIGVDHYWRDRLIWSDKKWSKYALNKNLETWVMRIKNELVGFYEKEFHPVKNEIELINMGILKSHQENRMGSVLLEHFLQKSLELKPNRLWVHTCSLDHKYALQNYKSKGFKIFKEEEIDFEA